jgi:RimJ/RimL family protein N-acetyltransferase
VMLKLVDVYTEIAENRPATKFLYELLKEREPHQNISHRDMPTFENHIRFIDSVPYREWLLIFPVPEPRFEGQTLFLTEDPVGAIYLSKQNEIGVSILKAHQGHGYGPLAICMLINRHPGEQFLANINPDNSRSITLFEGLGFKMLQVTYVKRPNHGTENEDRTCFVVGPTRPV